MRFRYLHIFLTILICKFSISNAQQESVDLYISSSYGLPGSIVSVQIQTNNFTDILSFQASLNWDPAILSYVGISDFGIKDFGEQNFGTTKADLGHIRFLWEPSDAIALTINDSTVLFSVSFEIISDLPQEVPVSFTDITSSPAFPIEFANSNYEVLTVNNIDGSITVINDMIDQINITTSHNSSCNSQSANGSLKADVDGDSLNYLFHWYVGSTISSSPDYTGYRIDHLPAGDYTLQVLDLNDMIMVESLAAVVTDETLNLSLVLTSTKNNFCQDGANGSATVSIVDPPNIDPRYYWFKENDQLDSTQARATGISYDNLASGNYSVWVIDLISHCATLESVTITDSLIYPEPVVYQRNDTLFANDDDSNWYRNGTLWKTGSLFLIPDISGSYSISITNEFGCSGESEHHYYGITGLEEYGAEISIYPNPFTHQVRILNPDGFMEFIKVFTSQGLLVEEIYDIKNRFTDIYLSSSSNGIYFIKLSKKGKIFTRKVVKNLSK